MLCYLFSSNPFSKNSTFFFWFPLILVCSYHHHHHHFSLILVCTRIKYCVTDMADSPVFSRSRLLTRSDSMRFFHSRGAVGFAYGFTFASFLFMMLLILNPSSYSSRIRNAFHSSRSYKFSRVFANIFHNSSSSPPLPNTTGRSSSSKEYNSSVTNGSVTSNKSGEAGRLDSQISRKQGSGLAPKSSDNEEKGLKRSGFESNGVGVPVPPPAANNKMKMGSQTQKVMKSEDWMELMRNNSKDCDMFDGSWIRDDSYPLYKRGSCPHIDEPFNCFLNGRTDHMFEKYRWQPKNCIIPRLNGNDMLELLRGKRLVFVGDSLNRNMWESLVCILRNSVQDKNRVFEASGKQEFRTEGSYSFIFTDYNCSIEFFRSPFLVQEWEIPDPKGSTKETLRLDLVERSCDRYKNADVLIFNTGHWWTHEKRIMGKEYYQEGEYIHGQLSVEEAFHKALLTWSQWVDGNVDPKKTIVFFRGYSPSHFRGGEWNSGGQCEKDLEPIKNETELSENPPMMRTIESVIKRMKTPVLYLNITKMTDFRTDAHPSMYRNMNMSQETKRYMLTHQDCSHWCLPGVPDLWNELVYAHLLSRTSSMHKKKGSPQR